MHSSRNLSMLNTAKKITTADNNDEAELLALERQYCSFGDTVHYLEPPKIFERCEGSYIYDSNDTPFLDLQRGYSAVNLGYANPRINDAVTRQLDTLHR